MSNAASLGWYEIRVRGRLGTTLLSAFPGLEAETQRGETVLAGALPDQAALHGVLAQVEALGLDLLEVRRRPPAPDRPARITRIGRRPLTRTAVSLDVTPPRATNGPAAISEE